MKKQFGLTVAAGLLVFSHSTSFAQYAYVPTDAGAAGITRVVPDMLLWYNQALGCYTNGPIANLADQAANMANWEPYLSVLGDSVFLIGGNTFADDGTLANQRFAVTFQPVAGGSPKIGDHFYSDAGTPYRLPVNLSRQNGNPERVAGDKRTGATNFLTTAEASLGQLPAFQSNARWTNNPCYQGTNRYVCCQPFSLDTATLTQTPLALAWDYVYGPRVTSTPPNPANVPQLSRVGGSVVGLDDGNFVVLLDDRTSYSDSGAAVTVFAIMTPTGDIVKGPTLVDPRDIWDNLCAYRGGFAIRCHNLLYFFDNAGNFKFGASPGAATDINATSGLAFGTGREDASRIGSDIRSHYVYLAGETPEAMPNHHPCSIAVWDADTGLCVATNTVTDTDPTVHTVGRVVVAVDARDHFCVVWSMNPDPTVWLADQVVARVGALNGLNVRWLTPSFFAFANHESDPMNVQGFKTFNPSVAMTTDYICISARGFVNNSNNPAAGPNTAPDTSLYTVLQTPTGPAYTPTDVTGVGLAYVVPDMLLWYNGTLGRYTNGPIFNTADQAANLGNWEPNISVLGNSVFLIGANTFADDGTLANQRFAVTFQPVAGGLPKIGDHFCTDAGAPYRLPVNLSRQNGNPQRVAGDKRLGATNFLTAGEASLGQIAMFNSNIRWANNPCYQGTNRYVCCQPFSLDPTTLVQTPLALAWDYVYGPLVTGTPPNPANVPQVSRTGGTVVALDDGNFVVMIDDKTSYSHPNGEVTAFSIITPTGAIVKSATLVDARDIWDNLCAYQGGFAIRCHDLLYFFDNAGNFKFGSGPGAGTDLNFTSGLTFGVGREDASRIASDIRSHYVYLAGETPETQGAHPCSIAIWDADTGQCVATNTVTDTDPAVHKMERVNLAVDAHDRFCVAWGMNPDPLVWTNEQIIARVGKFNGAQIAWLTPSFYAFINHESDPANVKGFKTSNPSVAMTTDYICIAARGSVNNLNNPTAGPNTAPDTTLYTVIRSPVGPAITRQPTGQTVMVGSDVTFSVVATGTPPLSYQWRFNGTNIAGATDSVLILNNVQTNNAGAYSVLVTNAVDATTSEPATLTVSLVPVAPLIVVPPSNVAVTQGLSATFSVIASGTEPLGYFWRKGITPVVDDGGRVSGATTPTLTITDVQHGDAGNYSVLVTNAAGATSSAPATLTVHCKYLTAPGGAAYDWPGGSGSVSVSAGSPCAWTASGATWVTITAGSSGTGTGTVAYAVQPNYTTNSRQTDLTIAGQPFSITQAAYPSCQPPLEIIQAPTSNSFKTVMFRQTGLVEGIVRVTNLNCGPPPESLRTASLASPEIAILVWIQNLPSGVQVYNAIGSSNGVPYIKYNWPPAPGESVDLHVEFFVPDRRTVPNPVYVAEWAVADAPYNPPGTPVPVDRALFLTNWTYSYYLVDFSTVSNQTYYIQYSGDLTNWTTALPGVAGSGSRKQWVDNGPPKTESLPLAVGSRFYRVIRVP